MKRLSLLTILTMALTPVPLLAQTGAAGTWTASFETQIGVQDYTYVFEVDGMTLTGTAKSSMSETPSAVRDGKIEGNTLTFVENLNYQGMELVITYKGTLAGDEIRFTRMVGEFATEELTAKRAETQ